MSRTSGIAATAVTVGAVILLGSPSALAVAPVLPLPGAPGMSGAVSTLLRTPWAEAARTAVARRAGSSDAEGPGLGAGLELPPAAAVRAVPAVERPAVERPAAVVGTTTGARVGRPPSAERLVMAVLLALGTALAVIFLNRRRPVARG